MIYLTIAIFRCFSKQPSPLNGMVGDNHRVRWFSKGFRVSQPLCHDDFRWLSSIGQTMRCFGLSFQSNHHIIIFILIKGTRSLCPPLRSAPVMKPESEDAGKKSSNIGSIFGHCQLSKWRAAHVKSKIQPSRYHKH